MPDKQTSMRFQKINGSGLLFIIRSFFVGRSLMPPKSAALVAMDANQIQAPGFAKIFLVLIPLLLTQQLFGKITKIPTTDFLVTNTGDTIRGSVVDIGISGFNPRYLKKIRVTRLNGKTVKINRKKVHSFQKAGFMYEAFYLRGASSKFALVTDTYHITKNKGKLYFLKCIKKGPLSHYHLEWFEQASASHNYMDLLIKTGSGSFIRATQGVLGLKRSLVAAYLSDCKELNQLILAKKTTKLPEIIDFYNNQCQ